MDQTVSKPVSRRGRPVRPDLAAARREQILAAATTHFARRGYQGTDLQELADELGVGKGTLYRHFGSKEGLFLAAADRAIGGLFAYVAEASAAVSDGLERIARAIRAYLAYFDAHPEAVELLILERAVFRDRKTPTYFEYRERAVGEWHRLHEQLMAQGRVRTMSPEKITDVFSGTLYGTMFVNFFAGRRKPLDTQADQIIDIVFRGILTDEERARLTGGGADA